MSNFKILDLNSTATFAMNLIQLIFRSRMQLGFILILSDPKGV